MDKKVHVFYSGYVQGVGFRFTTRRAASSIGGLTGWVRNLPDGRVELEAEGEQGKLTRLLESIKSVMGPYIEGSDVQWSEPSGEFSKFDIKFF
jgi:acylphosphatase